MEITIEEIKDKFEKLPEDLKWAIMAAKVDEKITAIGQGHGLNIGQMGQLALEVYMVMLGYTHPESFEDSLKASLGLPTEKNREIVVDVNNKILREIKDNLKSYYDKKDNNEEEKAPEFEEIKTEDVQSFPEDQKPIETENDIIKNIQNKKIMESISSKKLSGSLQTPTVKTEYSLNNITKDQEKTGTSVSQNVKIPSEATTKTAPVGSEPYSEKKEDPYRLKPE